MDGEEQEKHMGKGKRVKKKKPFLEDDMEQSEVSYSNYLKISKYHNCIYVHAQTFVCILLSVVRRGQAKRISRRCPPLPLRL